MNEYKCRNLFGDILDQYSWELIYKPPSDSCRSSEKMKKAEELCKDFKIIWLKNGDSPTSPTTESETTQESREE